MADIVITDADGNRDVAARAGDTLAVQLPENPTTGYRWVQSALDRNILESIGDDFQTSAQTGVGAGGLHVFRFTAKRTGNSRIEFKLARAWEAGPPKALFSVAVKVA